MFVCVSFFSYNFVCKLLTDWIKLSLLSDKTDNNIFVDDGVPAIMKDNHQHRNIYSNDKTHTKSHADISERYSISVIYIVDIHLYFSSLVCLLNSTCQSCTMSLCLCLFSHLTAWPFGCPCSYFFHRTRIQSIDYIIVLLSAFLTTFYESGICVHTCYTCIPHDIFL